VTTHGDSGTAVGTWGCPSPSSDMTIAEAACGCPSEIWETAGDDAVDAQGRISMRIG